MNLIPNFKNKPVKNEVSCVIEILVNVNDSEIDTKQLVYMDSNITIIFKI